MYLKCGTWIESSVCLFPFLFWIWSTCFLRQNANHLNHEWCQDGLWLGFRVYYTKEWIYPQWPLLGEGKSKGKCCIRLREKRWGLTWQRLSAPGGYPSRRRPGHCPKYRICWAEVRAPPPPGPTGDGPADRQRIVLPTIHYSTSF